MSTTNAAAAKTRPAPSRNAGARAPGGVAAPPPLPRRVGARFAQPEFSCKRAGLPPDAPRAAIRIGEAFNFPVENPLEHLQACPHFCSLRLTVEIGQNEMIETVRSDLDQRVGIQRAQLAAREEPVLAAGHGPLPQLRAQLLQRGLTLRRGQRG